MTAHENISKIFKLQADSTDVLYAGLTKLYLDSLTTDFFAKNGEVVEIRLTFARMTFGVYRVDVQFDWSFGVTYTNEGYTKDNDDELTDEEVRRVEICEGDIKEFEAALEPFQDGLGRAVDQKVYDYTILTYRPGEPTVMTGSDG